MSRSIFTSDAWLRKANWWKAEPCPCRRKARMPRAPTTMWARPQWGTVVCMDSPCGCGRAILTCLSHTPNPALYEHRNRITGGKTEFETPKPGTWERFYGAYDAETWLRKC